PNLPRLLPLLLPRPQNPVHARPDPAMVDDAVPQDREPPIHQATPRTGRIRRPARAGRLRSPLRCSTRRIESRCEFVSTADDPEVGRTPRQVTGKLKLDESCKTGCSIR